MSASAIVTFYSYKGGAGRSFTLANVAVVLAAWGYRVLCIDWDLEAPSLHRYFAAGQGHTHERRPGVVELVQTLRRTGKADWRDYVHPVVLTDRKLPLALMPAGVLDDDYVGRMQDLDWPMLYSKHGLSLQIERLREAWTSEYDVVLVDSRTGVTDTSGICTIQLPHQLCVFFTASHESLHGVLRVARQAAEQRRHLPFNRLVVPCVPVPTRFDGRVERKLAECWLDTFATALEPLYSTWRAESVTARQILDFIRIPYVPYWSFGEELAVVEEGTQAPESIGYAIETLAALLAHRLDYTKLMVDNRDEFVARAQMQPGLTAQYRYQVFISFDQADGRFARALARRLTQRGISVAPADETGQITDADYASLHRLALACRSFAFIIGRSTVRSRWREFEIDTILKSIYESRRLSPRRIVNILRKDVVGTTIPPLLQTFVAVDAGPSDNAELGDATLARILHALGLEPDGAGKA